MLADGGDGRKLTECNFQYEWLAFGGPAQINFKVQEAAILFDSHNFGHVEMSAVQQFELAPKVKIKKSLYRAMRRDNACLDACVAYGLLDFNPFLILSDLWTA